MPKYELVLEDSGSLAAERVELHADCASAAISWGERSARGRKFEIFEDGRSLGSASLSSGANFWVLSPASQQSCISARARPEKPVNLGRRARRG